MKIAVLCVQGAFEEHEKVLQGLGAEMIELRKKEDVSKEFDGLVLPGGESTVQGKLLRELDMFDILKEKIENGMPVLATCAGLILLAEHISNDTRCHFGTIPMTVKRNAYGRQLESFYTEAGFGEYENIPMEFIRAPYIEQVSDDVEVMSVVDGNIVGVKYKNQIGVSFHPELCDDTRIHEMFLRMVENNRK